MPLKRKKPDSFIKTAYKNLEESVDAIDKISDREERLRQYERLEQRFGSLFGNGAIQKSVDKLELNDAGKSAFFGIVGGILTGVPFYLGLIVVSFAIGALPISTVATLAAFCMPAVIGGYLWGTNRFSVKKQTGLSFKEAKYVIRAKRLEEWVTYAADQLAIKIAAKKDYERLNKFNRAAAGTSSPVAASRPAAAPKLAAPAL